MQQSLLGWVVVAFGVGLILRVLCRRNDSMGEAVGFLSVGSGAVLTGLWLVHLLDLPRHITQVIADL